MLSSVLLAIAASSALAAPRSLPASVFIDTGTRTAVWGRYDDGGTRMLFDQEATIRFRGADEDGMKLATPADSEALYRRFGFYATFGLVTFVTLSPDRTQVLFGEGESDTYPWSGLHDIRSGRTWFFSRLPAEQAAWSPDGKTIAYRVPVGSGVDTIFIVDPLRPYAASKELPAIDRRFDASSTGETNLEDGNVRISSFSWSTRSSIRFTVVPQGATKGSTWIYDLDQGKSRSVSE